MMKRQVTPYLLAGVALLLIASGFGFISSHRYHKEIKRSSERELKTTLSAGFGKVSVARGHSMTILEADFDTDKERDLDRLIDYSVRENVGYLSLTTEDEFVENKKSFHISGFESTTWNLLFSDAIPISFDIQLGLGKGEFDLSGLAVKDFNLSAGASSVVVRFDRPNTAVLDDLTIEAGLSKFRGIGLGNANFNHLKFEGGVGTYSLDFGGELKREVDVDIEVGLGSLTIIIPEHIGAKVSFEQSLIAYLFIDEDFTEQKENTYLSSNYYSSTGKMNIHIDAGLGSVKIKRE